MFNDWLLSQLQEQKWSQADLARASSLTTAAISKYINGRIPDEGALRKLAKALHLPPELVYEKAGILPPKPDNLSEEQQKIIHQVAQVDDDKTLRMISAMLDQALEDKKRENHSHR